MELKKDGNGRKVAVIGAGPAGLVCAEILADRGFDVTLIEKSDKAGGQINLAAAPPKKGKTAWFIEDAVAACEEKGVKILLDTPASLELIRKLDPYKIIVATGSKPVKPKFGINPENEPCTFEDILTGKVVLKDKKVAVIGSGMTGLETAHALTENGCKVTVVEMADEIAPGIWMQHKDDVMPKLRAAGTEFVLGEKLRLVGDGYITVENVKSGEKRQLSVDDVVLSLGSRPDNSFADELRVAGYNPILIGDCKKVGRIADATKAAYEAAVNLK